MTTAARRIALVAIPAVLLATIVSAALVEAWVRLTWDDERGRPGFYVSDPLLGQRLSPGYDGWFAGVPVHINKLGFRDDRDYDLTKGPNTFRILVLGDSVTFGHGTLYETTYPYLVEQRLRAWRPDVDWQVWNLGVPGYATSQELAQLERVGARYQPDLVVVGFFQNDLTGNEPPFSPSLARRAASAVLGTMERHVYSYEFYKRAYLTIRWRLFTSDTDRQRLEHLITEEIPLGRRDYSAGAESQELTKVTEFSPDEVSSFSCALQPVPDPRPAANLRARLADPDADFAAWINAVRAFQQLQAQGRYRVAFFINMAPEVCQADDRFYDGGTLAVDDVLLEVMGKGTPVASSTRAFLRFRPSEMPGASGHSVGNANVVKADVLFAFLRDHVLSTPGSRLPVPGSRH